MTASRGTGVPEMVSSCGCRQGSGGQGVAYVDFLWATD